MYRRNVPSKIMNCLAKFSWKFEFRILFHGIGKHQLPRLTRKWLAKITFVLKESLWTLFILAWHLRNSFRRVPRENDKESVTFKQNQSKGNKKANKISLSEKKKPPLSGEPAWKVPMRWKTPASTCMQNFSNQRSWATKKVRSDAPNFEAL